MSYIMRCVLHFCSFHDWIQVSITLIILSYKKYQDHSFMGGLFLSIKDTLNKLGYKAKINTHTTSYIN